MKPETKDEILFLLGSLIMMPLGYTLAYIGAFIQHNGVIQFVGSTIFAGGITLSVIYGTTLIGGLNGRRGSWSN